MPIIMDKDRVLATLANINMNKNILFTSVSIAEIIAIAACQVTGGVSPTISSEPGQQNNPNTLTVDPTAEIVKITAGELTVVSDQTTKEKIITSLPQDRPEALGEADVFNIRVGDENIPTVMYPIVPDTIIKSVAPDGTENKTLQSIATYTEFVDVDGNKSWVRLFAINPDPNVKATVWAYDPSGIPASDQTVTVNRAVLGYQFDEESDKLTSIKFQPLFVNPNYIPGYNYTDAIDVTIVGTEPSGMKVQAMMAKPEMQIPEAKSDLNPVYAETISGELLGVSITTNLITDESLDPIITAIKINPNFHNSEGKNSQEAITEFTARTFYKVWLKKGGVDGTGPKTDVTFEDYMAMWAEAQASGREEDWRAVQITIKANDIATEGYEPVSTTIWFGYSNTAPEGVRAINEFDIAFVKGNKVENINSPEGYSIGMGTNLDKNRLVIYIGLQTTNINTNTATIVVQQMSGISIWITQSSIGYNSNELINIFATKILSNAYKAAIQVFPQTKLEIQYNP